MSVILDTDHCIAILRGTLDPSINLSPETRVFLTVVTVAELAYGAHRSARPDHHLEMVRRLVDAATVLSFDAPAAYRLGQLKNGLREAGTPLAEPDLQIASIALEHQLPLATHNQRHFNRIPGLILQDWIGDK